MSEIIYEEIVDSDSVICHIKRGEIIRCRDCKWWQDNNNGYPVADCKTQMIFVLAEKGENHEVSISR